MRTFNWSGCAVRSALANGLNLPKSRGPDLAVQTESDAKILAWMKKQAGKMQQ
jgi:hypothetical protein